MAKEKTKLQRTGWSSNFTLVGTAVVNDRTFKLDQRSQNSDWISNRMNLGVNCGEKNGTVYCELWGGYGENRENKIYVHGKKEDNTDDYQNQYVIAWEDRNDDEITSSIGRGCFTQIGLEKTSAGTTSSLTILAKLARDSVPMAMSTLAKRTQPSRSTLRQTVLAELSTFRAMQIQATVLVTIAVTMTQPLSIASVQHSVPPTANTGRMLSISTAATAREQPK